MSNRKAAKNAKRLGMTDAEYAAFRYVSRMRLAKRLGKKN